MQLEKNKQVFKHTKLTSKLISVHIYIYMLTGQGDGVKKTQNTDLCPNLVFFVPILLQNSHLSEISEIAVPHQMYYNQFCENRFFSPHRQH